MDIPDKKRKIPPQRNSPVKKGKSRILIVLAAGLAGILILIMAVVFSIDPNNYREPVIQVLNRATGLNINIEFIDWTFSRGLQFKCKGLQIKLGEPLQEDCPNKCRRFTTLFYTSGPAARPLQGR